VSVYRRDGLPWLRVHLRSRVGDVELSTLATDSGYQLLDGVKGLGIPSRTVESSPIPGGNGSAFRAQRFDESEMVLPISVKGMGPDKMAELRRRLEAVLLVDQDDPVEVVVESPGLGTVRRRWAYYTEGLEGALGGQDSHLVWNHLPLRLLALDPMWWGETVRVPFRIKAERKPFLSNLAGEAEPARLVRTNYVLNPNAASLDNVAPASAQAASLAVDEEVSYTGPSSIRATRGQFTGVFGVAFAAMDVTVGSRLGASAWVRSVGSVRIQVQRLRGDIWQSWTSTAAAEAVSDGEWVRVAVAETQQSAEPVRVVITRVDASVQGDELWVDTVALIPADLDQSWFSGDSVSSTFTYDWEGMPGASASREWSLPVTDGTLATPFFPVVLESSTVQGSHVVDIQGDGTVYPVWMVDGPGEDLHLVNTTTGEEFLLEGPVQGTLTLDSRTQEISMGGLDAGELWDRVPLDSRLFTLKPGRNELSLTMVGSTTSSVVWLEYMEQWRAGY
jgi:phage-related protein